MGVSVSDESTTGVDYLTAKRCYCSGATDDYAKATRRGVVQPTTDYRLIGSAVDEIVVTASDEAVVDAGSCADCVVSAAAYNAEKTADCDAIPITASDKSAAIGRSTVTVPSTDEGKVGTQGDAIVLPTDHRGVSGGDGIRFAAADEGVGTIIIYIVT